MLKSFALTLLLASCSVPVVAQTTPPVASQFCSLAVSYTIANRQNLALDYGQKSKTAPVTDAELQQEASAVDALDSSVQALNYLSGRGWQVVGFTSVGTYERFYFRRVKP